LPRFLVRYVGRVGWLIRNSAYGFEFGPLGAEVYPVNTYRVWGWEQTTNNPLHEGWVLRVVINCDNSKIFQFYFVKRMFYGKVLRIMIGHKLWQNPEPGRKQFAINFNPFKRITI